MTFGQYSAALVVASLALLLAFAKHADENGTPWKRSIAYFSAGALTFGLISCVLVAAQLNINMSFN